MRHTGSRFTLTLVVSLVLGAGATAVNQPVATAQSTCESLNIDLHQLLNPDNAANLLTIYSGEVSSAEAKYGFHDVGVIANVAAQPADGLVAVQRFQKGGDFLWASDEQEAGAARAAAYVPGGEPLLCAGGGE
jgi:hypothetical protein